MTGSILLERIQRAPEDAIALEDALGAVTYGEARRLARSVAAKLLRDVPSLDGAPVAWMAPPGRHAVAALWGTWMAGGISVPIGVRHPGPEIDHLLRDSGAGTVLMTPDMMPRLLEPTLGRGIRLVDLEPVAEGPSALPSGPGSDRGALLLYTSGTTSRPKGVLHTHRSLGAQIAGLTEAWEWSAEDRILAFLPLHHVHGLVNVACSAAWNGARCDFLSGFEVEEVWTRIVETPVTLFMAVPTVYHRLLGSWNDADADTRRLRTEACRRLRVMISGSAALPVPLLEAWREVSGHVLLERYGMTEIGMALSNPLRGERSPGLVGEPLPGVAVRLVDESGTPLEGDGPGELEVKGPAVFREYWRNPEATRAAFREGWFATGDTALREEGGYRILGRTSIDILKSGGYKLSALEIEGALLEHPGVGECAVVGIPDPELGERVVAAIVPVPGREPGGEADLREWLEGRLAPYKIPRQWVFVAELPRNALGKVVKPRLVEMLATR